MMFLQLKWTADLAVRFVFYTLGASSMFSRILSRSSFVRSGFIKQVSVDIFVVFLDVVQLDLQPFRLDAKEILELVFGNTLGLVHFIGHDGAENLEGFIEGQVGQGVIRDDGFLRYTADQQNEGSHEAGAVLSVGAVVQDGVLVGVGHDLEDFCVNAGARRFRPGSGRFCA